MNEPTPENNKNLDELTRLTLRTIKLESDIEQLRTEFAATKNSISIPNHHPIPEILDRIKVLEDARARQMALNATFVQKGTETKAVKPIWSFWK
jgi:hypothetical protein